MIKNKNLLITGAATRVGKAIAIHFAERGWNIALHYFKSSSKARKLKKIIEQNWVKVILIKADLKNPKQVEKIVPLAKRKLGRIGCLINNAALFEKDDITNFTTKSWNNHLNINLLAPTILIKQFVKQAPKKSVSNIINIIDQRIFSLTPFFMSYTLSKSGLQTLTKTMAMRLGPDIKVNGIAPGPTIKSKRQTDRHFRNQVKSTLLKKSVRLEDICENIEFLINNNSVTGQIIAVDSGQNLSWNKKNEKE
jgi:NAD(P)-dependent dehydrogenase (short-subunit alcohol dehydrogenase family)